MTTFQAIVYAIIRGFTQFIPLSWEAHRILISWLIHWPEPSGFLEGTLSLGMFLAAFLYFWNDWASLLSCLLQVIFLRRKPMTLDERMPFFVAIAVLPALLIAPRLTVAQHLNDSPLIVAGVLGAFAIPLWLTDSMSRKNKNLFDWNWLDALLVSVFLLVATLLAGIGEFSVVLAVAFFRNYSREAAAKFAIYSLAPILLAQALRDLSGLDFHASSPLPDVSWLTLGVALVVSSFAGVLTIGALMKHLQRKGMGQYAIYRLVFALGAIAVIWYRNQMI